VGHFVGGSIGRLVVWSAGCLARWLFSILDIFVISELFAST
jgi:hypothetical protein